MPVGLRLLVGLGVPVGPGVGVGDKEWVNEADDDGEGLTVGTDKVGDGERPDRV